MSERKANWFTYFPDNYRWSAAILHVFGTAQWGGGEMGETHQVGLRLAEKVGDDDHWFRCWKWMGDRVAKLGGEAEAKGMRATAAGAYLRAANYYQIGERFRTPKDEEGLAVYRKAVQCFQKGMALRPRPRVETVEVPYEGGGSLPAYFVHAEGARSGKPPCVVFFDGLDVTKEIQYFHGVPAIVERGMSCLIVDGPGTGESIRFRGHYLRHDYEVAARAACDYLGKRPDVDAGRLGILAISLGGYYAPRSAAFEKRFKACVAWGAIWDYHATWKKRIEAAFQTSLSVPGHHIMWILNAKSPAEALKKLEPFKLDGVAQKVTCPFLLTHGAEDEQIPLADAQALFDAVGSEDKTFKVFTAEEGGAQHCQRDNKTLGVTYMADWLAEKLRA